MAPARNGEDPGKCSGGLRPSEASSGGVRRSETAATDLAVPYGVRFPPRRRI